MSSGESIESSADPLADVSREISRLRDLARRILELEGQQGLPLELIQEGLSSLSKLYAVRYEQGERKSPFPPEDRMPATAVMILVSAALRAVNVEPFELGMWQTWSGARKNS